VLVTVLVLATGCSDTVGVDAPDVSGSAARACASLLRALPERVADQPRRKVDPGRGYAAAWGDPAIELRCGVPRPDELTAVSPCQHTNGVDWFIPASQQSGQTSEVTMTTVGRAVNIEVSIPSDDFPPATTMVDLAPAVKRTLRLVRPCL
jgi:hypothetical protein